ncbi:dual specificity protein phosphatase family protein [Telmatocola sphagniphila]|uniref:Dual specificity protein phosphatase family protein n=1 Tax=Telmatocola sphagniphila TaxID=1123043 RepID=A0A8E6EX38_9BACT|nr:dual specificity protein phosphatase family protein [Telmatocola sphagniphila]
MELTSERLICESFGIGFFACPIPDRGLPESMDFVTELLEKLTILSANDSRIAFHCRQGIGRSSMLLAAYLVLQGVSSTKAFTWLTEARGRSVPDTQEQREWVEYFEATTRNRSKMT